MECKKMQTNEHVELVCTKLVNVAESNSKIRKDYKEDILESLSDLRNIFAELIITINEENKGN